MGNYATLRKRKPKKDALEHIKLIYTFLKNRSPFFPTINEIAKHCNMSHVSIIRNCIPWMAAGWEGQEPLIKIISNVKREKVYRLTGNLFLEKEP